jgi:hypothetical protein
MGIKLKKHTESMNNFISKSVLAYDKKNTLWKPSKNLLRLYRNLSISKEVNTILIYNTKKSMASQSLKTELN